MNKRITSLLLVFVMALSLLTACGKSISLDKTELTFTAAGETVQLTADTKADALNWTSSDESIASVDANGLVTAVAPGTATITVSDGKDLSATCTVKCEWEVVVDLTEFLYSLADAHGENFAANMSLTEMPEMLEMCYPGLAAIPTKQLLAYQPMMGAVVCEIALIEVENAADMDAVKEILQARIDMQGEGGGAWYPESVEGWINNSRIVSNGNYVMMIAWMYCDEAVEAFNALF